MIFSKRNSKQFYLTSHFYTELPQKYILLSRHGKLHQSRISCKPLRIGRKPSESLDFAMDIDQGIRKQHNSDCSLPTTWATSKDRINYRNQEKRTTGTIPGLCWFPLSVQDNQYLSPSEHHQRSKICLQLWKNQIVRSFTSGTTGKKDYLHSMRTTKVWAFPKSDHISIRPPLHCTYLVLRERAKGNPLAKRTTSTRLYFSSKNLLRNSMSTHPGRHSLQIRNYHQKTTRLRFQWREPPSSLPNRNQSTTGIQTQDWTRKQTW